MDADGAVQNDSVFVMTRENMYHIKSLFKNRFWGPAWDKLQFHNLMVFDEAL